MPVAPTHWTPFATPEERLDYLKEHKLTPKTYTAPKELVYAGIDAAEPVPCTAEGTAGGYTLVIRVGEELHCIHPDYLAEMQTKRRREAPAPRRKAAPKPAAAPEVDCVAIDFETATREMDSACALGVAVVRGLEVVDTWYHLIQPPENRYEEANVHVHGITPTQTADQPTLDELWPELRRFFDGTLVLAHNARFDVGVLRKSLSQSDKIPNFRYADTLQMVKNVVPGRHGLDACCAYFGISLEHHHNALDDAVACAEVAICCAKLAGCASVRDCLRQRRLNTTDFHRKPSTYQRYATKAVRLSDVTATVEQFDLTHPLYQKTVVFTGDLAIDRAEAVQRAVNKGAAVKSGVSAKTDVLVVGRQGQSAAAPESGKERKARELTEAGKANIRVMDEAEFMALVGE